ACVLTNRPNQTNALAGKIGSALHCQRSPRARSRVMRYSDSDISKTSNSSFFRLRKKSSGGVVTVISRSSRGDATVFSTSGSKRGFLVTPILSVSIGFSLAFLSYIRRADGELKTCSALHHFLLMGSHKVRARSL